MKYGDKLKRVFETVGHSIFEAGDTLIQNHLLKAKPLGNFNFDGYPDGSI